MKKHSFLRYFLVLILLSVSTLSFSQTTSNYTKSKTAIKLFDKAITNVEGGSYSEAVSNLNKAIEKDVNFLEAYFFLAEIYEISDKFELSIKNYEKVFEIDPYYDVRTSLKLAMFSYNSAKYLEAKKYIDFFSDNTNTDEFKIYDIELLKKSIYFAEESYRNPVDFKPINLGEGVNTELNEYWPSLSIDERMLVFTRLVPIDNTRSWKDMNNLQEDLYVSIKDNVAGKYATAFPISGSVNTRDNEGAQCISADGKICIITACNRKDGKGSCDLYIMFYRNGKWTEPKNMETINTSHWETSPSLSADSKTLYFASTRPGGFGKSDIWKVEIDSEGRAKGQVENLGDKINTPYDEISPHIHPDGVTLYFASDGHPGMGGKDLFWSRLDNNEWQIPVNLGYPVNTYGDERGIIVNAKGDLSMYVSTSQRSDLDIYYFETPEESKPIAVTYVKGFVYDKKTNMRLQSECELLDLNSGSKVVDIVSEDKTGEYIVPLPVNKDYAFNVSRPGYLFYSENFSLTNLDDPTKPYIMNIPLQPIEEGSTIVLKNIFYKLDSFELLLESYTELNKVVDYMNYNSSLKIEIGGHTDNLGTKEYNKTLSESRAKSVFDYLLSKGIAAERLSYKGYDFSVPIADNNTEDGRALNRRTEFKIISTK